MLLVLLMIDKGYDDSHRHQFLNLTCVSTMLVWMKLMSFLKSVDRKLAAFVLMMGQIIQDTREFMIVLGVFMLMFGQAFLLRLRESESEEFDFHDEAKVNPWRNAPNVLQSLFLLVMVGDFDSNAYPDRFDVFILDMFIVIGASR